MSYAFVEDFAASWERYARFAAALEGSPPRGLILHLAGPTEEGFRIISVWESEDAWTRFAADGLGAELDPAPVIPPVFRALRPEHIVFGTKEEVA